MYAEIAFHGLNHFKLHILPPQAAVNRFAPACSRSRFSKPFAQTKKEPYERLFFFLAGAEGLEPSAHGFGDKYSFLIYSRLQAFGGHIGGTYCFL